MRYLLFLALAGCNASVEPVNVQGEPVEPDAHQYERIAVEPLDGAEIQRLQDLLSNTRRENRRLEKRIEWLEIELSLAGTGVTEGTVGAWLKTLLEEERPDAGTCRMLAEYLRDYPVTLTVEEGLWLADRIREEDWAMHPGDTVDETIILFLGPQRIAREVTEEKRRRLQGLWYEEGYFAK